MKLQACLALVLLAPCLSFAAAITYTFQDLGPAGVNTVSRGMNDRGWVVGYGPLAGTTGSVALRSRPGVGTEPLSRLRSLGNGLNNAGVVVGGIYRDGVQRAFVRPPGQSWTDIGTLGGQYAGASRINELGQVVGSSTTATGDYHAFVYTPGVGMINLGTLGGESSSAYDINELGQVVGRSVESYDWYRTFLYTPGTGMVDLEAKTGKSFQGVALNDEGQVLGDAGGQGRIGYAQAAIYHPADNRIQRLGTLGGTGSEGRGINNRGWVVGRSLLPAIEDQPLWRAFLYVPGQGMMDVNTLVPDLGGAVLLEASDVNERGQITGTALVGNKTHMYLLTRVTNSSSAAFADAVTETPEPETYALLAAGLLSMAVWRRTQQSRS